MDDNEQPGHPTTPIRRILCLRLRSMGDAVLLTPALRELGKQIPEAEIHTVLDRELVDLFAGHPPFGRILPLTGGFRAKAAMAALVRRLKFDAVLNFHGGTTSAWLTAAAGAPVRVGRDVYRWRALYNVKAGKPESLFPGASEPHTVEIQASLVAALGVRVRDLSIRLDVSDRARRRLLARLDPVGIPNTGYVVIQPTASFPSKQWPAERFIEVGRDLKRRTGRDIVISLPPSAPSRARLRPEDVLRRRLDRRAAPRHTAAPPSLPLPERFAPEFPVLSSLPLDELAALLEGASLYLGNDSGPMHLAAAVGTPVAAIFGSSNPRRWHPWAVPHKVLWAGLDCSPCHGKWCVNVRPFACLDGPAVASVLDAALELLSSSSRGATAPRPIQESR